jgi:hypothetical protein
MQARTQSHTNSHAHTQNHARTHARAHTYVSVVTPQARAESLAADFHKRLGADGKISLAAASKDKLVMKVKGDDAFANEMVTAAQSFPETGMHPRFQYVGSRLCKL